MNGIWFSLFAILAGVSLTLQSGVNSQLREVLHNPFQAGFVSFAVGTIALGAYTIVQRLPWPISSAVTAPWWIWTGGLFGAFLVTSIVFVAPRLGATALVGLFISGQLLTALTLDHFGLLGFEAHPIRWERLLGVFFLMIGAIFIRKF